MSSSAFFESPGFPHPLSSAGASDTVDSIFQVSYFGGGIESGGGSRRITVSSRVLLLSCSSGFREQLCFIDVLGRKPEEFKEPKERVRDD